MVYFHADPQGTTEIVTDAGKATLPGRVVERRSYEPFGRLRSTDWAAGIDAPSVGRRNVGYTSHLEDEETPAEAARRDGARNLSGAAMPDADRRP